MVLRLLNHKSYTLQRNIQHYMWLVFTINRFFYFVRTYQQWYVFFDWRKTI